LLPVLLPTCVLAEAFHRWQILRPHPKTRFLTFEEFERVEASAPDSLRSLMMRIEPTGPVRDGGF
jgi:hypothetical protein